MVFLKFINLLWYKKLFEQNHEYVKLLGFIDPKLEPIVIWPTCPAKPWSDILIRSLKYLFSFLTSGSYLHKKFVLFAWLETLYKWLSVVVFSLVSIHFDSLQLAIQ